MARKEKVEPVIILANAAYELGGSLFLMGRWNETYLRDRGINQEALAEVRKKFKAFEVAVRRAKEAETVVERRHGNFLDIKDRFGILES